VQDGLDPLGERGEPRALTELGALLADREVEVVRRFRDPVEVVLPADREPPPVGEFRDRAVEREPVGGGEGKAGVVAVAVEQVGPDRVEALP
jgi:hypothetical protein